MSNLEKQALQQFTQSLCHLELDLFRNRQRWIKEDKMTQWFQSTPEKAAFGRLMYVSAVGKQSYTISRIARTLELHRNTIYRFLQDTVAANWVISKKTKKGVVYMASNALKIATEGYAVYMSDSVEKSNSSDDGVFYRLVRKRNSELHIQLKKDGVVLESERKNAT